jgi:hypothetical protein
MTTTTSHITEAMQGAIGGEIDRRVAYPLTESDIRRWAMACYYPEEPPRLYWDAEHAATTIHRGIVAPLDLNPFAWMSAEPRGLVRQGPHNPDRIEHALGIEGPRLKFMLNGGIEATYGVRMRPGDVITSVSRLAGYSEREGRHGLMLFTFSDDTWTNQDGEVVKVQRGTLIRYGSHA